MKPHRIRMAHNLLLSYGLYRKMEIYVRCLPLLSHSFAATVDAFAAARPPLNYAGSSR